MTRRGPRSGLRGWVLGLALLVAAPGAARACYCTPVVYDPSNHAVNMEDLARQVLQSDMLMQMVGLDNMTLDALGRPGGLSVAGLESRALRATRAFAVDGLSGDFQEDGCRMTRALIGQSLGLAGNYGLATRADGLERRAADATADTAGTVAGTLARDLGLNACHADVAGNVVGTATRDRLDEALGTGGGPGVYASVPAATTASVEWLRGPRTVSDPERGHILNHRRDREYKAALAMAHGAGVHGQQTAGQAPARVEALAGTVDDALNSSHNLRSQLGAQHASQAELLLAIYEELAGIRMVLASQLRLEAARRYDAMDAVGQQPYLARHGAIGGGQER